MHKRIFERLLENNNPELFLPQNLPLNLLHEMLNEDTTKSAILTTHAVGTLYKKRFNLDPTTPLHTLSTSKLFRSCVRKYTHFLLHEQTFRLKYTEDHITPTIDDIFISDV